MAAGGRDWVGKLRGCWMLSQWLPHRINAQGAARREQRANKLQSQQLQSASILADFCRTLVSFVWSFNVSIFVFYLNSALSRFLLSLPYPSKHLCRLSLDGVWRRSRPVFPAWGRRWGSQPWTLQSANYVACISKQRFTEIAKHLSLSAYLATFANNTSDK